MNITEEIIYNANEIMIQSATQAVKLAVPIIGIILIMKLITSIVLGRRN